ncbi:hypothetical protein A2U01_0040515, partial [Trifolium medium]|nr:hypothetical protein [Trifolium medium]
YSHLSFKGLNTLVKKDMVKGLPQLHDEQDTYAHCLTGKQHRDAIPKSSNWRATKQLELVHSDICGPITPHSNGGNRTDRGGEFTSNAFNDFCSNNGIKRQLTTAYTPQQNGVSERKNRTLLNM